jgi:anhydro-N-acetylmuramic acid kinase
MTELYIGLMSGTSVDGIDAVLVDLENQKPNVIATHFEKMPEVLRQSILDICAPGNDEINRMGELDYLLGRQFAFTANTLLEKNNIKRENILAIGSHGQTIRHHPAKNFTLQIGDPNVIAALTGITTIGDFRRRDIAHGGQGAPLVPAFHQAIFSDKNANRVILNIGGIANVTLLPAQGNVLGFDTGPGNTLIDAWAQKHLQKRHDEKGIWASEGTIDKSLLENLLSDNYFKLTSPKSTGREYFNIAWLEKYLSLTSPNNIQATLVELTALSIINAIDASFEKSEIFVCGGGVHNDYLMLRLKELSKQHCINSTASLGVDPDWVEAIAFAWLAKQTLAKKPGNLTA